MKPSHPMLLGLLLALLAPATLHAQMTPSEQEAEFTWTEQVGLQIGSGAYCKVDPTLLEEVRRLMQTRIATRLPPVIHAEARRRLDLSERIGYRTSQANELDCAASRWASGEKSIIATNLLRVRDQLAANR